MKISVVIPTYNRREILARTLDTLFAQDFPCNQYEIVVAVDGSTDGTVEFVRALRPACPLHVVQHSRNLGQAAARNSAIMIAQGEVVVMIDDDLLCDRALVKEHLAAHEGAALMVVSGPVLTALDSAPTLATARLLKLEQSYPERIRGEHSWYQCNGGQNISVRRDLLLTSGRFDERLFRMSEDIDLILRLHKSGRTILFPARRYCAPIV